MGMMTKFPHDLVLDLDLKPDTPLSLTFMNDVSENSKLIDYLELARFPGVY